MANKFNRLTVYEIRVEGHLDLGWTKWFEGMSITLEDDGETLMRGSVEDQAALHGLLRKVRDLGMPLISAIRVKPGPSAEPDVKQRIEPGRPEREKRDVFN